MHRTDWEPTIRPCQPESGFSGPVHENFVGQIDEGRARMTREDATLHHADERIPQAEVGGQCDDATGRYK
jgi:hypothetical protein